MEKVYTYKNNFFINLLLEAYPYLKKREAENPEPALVEIVKKIEDLQKYVNGDEDES